MQQSSEPPIQFSLKTAFGLMLLSAVTLVIYRQSGLLIALYCDMVVLFLLVGSLHLMVMLRLTNRPKPWGQEQSEVVALGWLMFFAFAVCAALMLLKAGLRFKLIRHDDAAIELGPLLLVLVYVLAPVSVFCSVHTRRISSQAFASEPRLARIYQITSIAIPLGMPMVPCLQCL